MATVKKKVINISVVFNHNGNHYQGMALFDGVGLGLVDAPCGPARQLINLTNAGIEGVDWPSGVLADAVSCVNDKSDKPVPAYLKIKPI